ncbi:actin cytoskeleton-regulatory complex protein pan1-like isoform X2 [Colias croceus]|uniref:actin cytoskeleton-regulatory complex protein pan1-like isoform X2 n=1 Tax=Colias crocea TaxID=72248 RepID=UPI001E27A673|nr:actin cytoskeleton-regulatory complex protein pan1-like isoform X2 [Colias croceus]
MAPSPEYDKEPKAPDKSVVSISSDDSKVHYNHTKEQPTISDQKSAVTNNDVENKHVETLDDGQLRALLDEAITYKCPKDREGKSSLFKELLEEVEQDEEACEAAARSCGARGGRRNRGRREHHSSLQDLVAAMAAEPAPRRRPHHHPHGASSVSARTHHGGSLPSGVDTSFLLSEEPTRGGYLATVRCVNPPPLAERRVSASDANAPPDVELVTRRSKPMFPMTYTARATLEIGSGSVCSGRAVTTTTASNQVDSAIPFSCITTPEVVASCNTTSTTQSTVAVDPKPRNVLTTTTFSGLPLARPNYGSTACSSADDYKVPILTVHYRLQKSLDENGNAVHGFGSPVSGSSQHKKPRRKKSSKNETVIKSHQIDGYQGNKDLNEVLRFIESNADGARAHKMGRKHKDDCDDKGKKRSAERRKDKGAKITRASSLEELSRTKLEDLTAKGAPAKPERRSWGDDARAALLLPDDELTDFQTVTKRRKPRRRADELPPAPRPRPARRASPSAPSAPPSDRSNDSNDDLDSVHSLPADAPQSRSKPAPPAPSAPPAPPPPPPAPPAVPVPTASYADIARTRHNIPDLIESCNFYAEGDGEQKQEPPPPNPKITPPVAADAVDYPALNARRPRDKPAAPPAARVQRKERPEAGRPADMPAPDVVADRRPPVILLDSEARPRDMDGVTFGFDINEQLLSGPARRPRCDLLRDAPEGRDERGAAAGAGGGGARGGLAVRAGCLALRYVPPDPPADTAHLHQIIDYVGSAWEDVVRCGGGKVRYFIE